MKNTMLSRPAADSHVHSRFSFDSDQTISGICERAAQLGLYAVTITDHCEVNVSGKSPYWSMDTMRGANRRIGRERERSDVRVLTGVELGQPAHNSAVAQALLDELQYDFVLASVHYLRDNRDFYYLDYHVDDPYEVYDKYLAELLETVRWGNFDSLAHMTYPLRYIIGRDGYPFDEQRYAARYDEILTLLAQKGKALEINTSGFARENGFSLPQVELVRRFRELGGRYITLGSDAHTAKNIGVGLERGLEIAHSAGFEHVCVYVRHQPVEI